MKIYAKTVCFLSTFLLASCLWTAHGQQPETPFSSYKSAFESGKETTSWKGEVTYKGKIIRTGFVRPYVDFAKAAECFRQAVELAENDREKAEALLNLGEARLYDLDEKKFVSVRENFENLLSLDALSQNEKARAYLGIGETYLREENYEAARRAFEKAGEEGLACRAELAMGFSYMQERNYDMAVEKLKALLEMEELEAVTVENRQTREIAMGYLAAMEQLPLIRRSRPRLFFNADTWPAVKARALNEERSYFEEAKEFSEKHIKGRDVNTRCWGSQLMRGAFIYRMEEDKVLLEKLKEMFRAGIGYYLSRENDWTRSYGRVSTVAALDWLWDDLSPQEREMFASGLLRYAYALYLEDRFQNRLGRSNWYYVQDMLWYTGIALLEDELDDVTHAKVLTLIGEGLRHMDTMFGHMSEISGDDGGWQPKLDYAFGHQPTVFWAFMHCLRSATGQKLPPEWIHIVNPDYVLRNFLGTTDKRIRQFGYARAWGDKRASPGLLYDHLRQTLHFFGQSQPGYASIAGHLKKRIKEEIGEGQGVHNVNPFLYTDMDKAPPPGIPEGMPIARHFEKIGLVLMSSGFGPEDTYALFACGGGEVFSEHYDATHFSINRKGYLALDSGSGNLDPHTQNYAKQTVAHNAVLIHMPGEENHGGQDKTTNFARVLAFETSPLFSYVATDATGTYNPAKCRQMVRQFIYLNPGLFLVFDRVASTKKEYAKEWLLHTSGEPEIAGKEFRADQGEGRIFCRTMYPADAVVEKVGGHGKEFRAKGQNWPLPWNFKRFGMEGPEDRVPDTLGRWRVEVSPGSQKEYDCFLHLVQVAGQDAEAMAESRVSEREGKLIVTFPQENRLYEITLDKTGDTGGHVKITEKGKTLVDRPLAGEVMPQGGLAIKQVPGEGTSKKRGSS